MTKTLSQIKAEARGRFYELFHVHPGYNQKQAEFFDSLIDATFLAIKEGVVPEESIDWGKEHPDDWVDCCGKGEVSGFNACRTEVLRNFDAMEGNEKSV